MPRLVFRVTKVGVGIDLDVKKVWEVLNLHVASWFDLRYLAFEFNQLKLRGFVLTSFNLPGANLIWGQSARSK